MCRIAGFRYVHRALPEDAETILDRMRDTLAHGGPDSAGSFIDRAHRTGLGHRRLSILDLSDAGRQPMQHGDWHLVFNGEIYNYRELRQELETRHGCIFSTGTDTEVILQAAACWGDQAVERFRGMFAFALWNARTARLLLCRDRAGKKPLYWHYRDGLLLFASELKALHAHPDFRPEVRQEIAGLFLQQGYIASPDTIFRHTWKVRPGCFITIDASGEIAEQVYWSPEDVYLRPPVPGAADEAALLSQLKELLAESCQLRLVSDVPVGMMLSGGIDSSLMLALLQERSAKPLETFTVGFEHAAYDESGPAQEIARILGAPNTSVRCRQSDFVRIAEQLPEIYDEPLGDNSGIPTLMVASLARRQVTVCLSGDGGDELFGGYPRYRHTQRIWPLSRRMPRPVLNGLRALAGPVLNVSWSGSVQKGLVPPAGLSYPVRKLGKMLHAMAGADLADFFDAVSCYIPAQQISRLAAATQARYPWQLRSPEPGRLLGFLGLMDLRTYLEGSILTKVDRATMQVALEARSPLLDHRVIEFALALPDTYKIRNGESKYLLRQLLRQYLPPEILNRPKQGFSVPLRDWMEELMLPACRAVFYDRRFADCFGLDLAQMQLVLGAYLHNPQHRDPQLAWFLCTLHRWYQRWIG